MRKLRVKAQRSQGPQQLHLDSQGSFFLASTGARAANFSFSRSNADIS